MEPALTIAPATTRFIFEPGFPRGRYVDAVTGAAVPWSTIRNVLDETLVSAGVTVRSLSQRLQAGQINLATWQREMEREIKSIHLASTALQRGGFQNMSQSNFGFVGNLLFNPNGSLEAGTAGQYAFLRRFAEEIASGLPLDGNFIRRSDQYVKAGRQTYHIVETREMQAVGFTEERFILAPVDSCRTSPKRLGCIERADAEWEVIGKLPNIGGCTCHQNCQCGKEYRNADGLVWRPT